MELFESFEELALGVGGVAGAFVVAGLATVVIGLALHMSSRRTSSFLVHFAYMLLFSMAVNTLVSGRDFAVALENKKVEGPLVSVANWCGTLFFLVGVIERFATAAFHQRIDHKVPLGFLLSFIATWCMMVGLPMFYGAFPKIEHNYTYMLFIGIAMMLSDPDDLERAIASSRNAILLFLLASIIALAVSRNLTLDLDYVGLIPGLPRYAGLAPGAIGMGTICIMCIFFLWVKPYKSRALNIWSWALLIISFLLAQVKTAWSAFIFCWVAMMWVRHGRQIMDNISKGRYVGTTVLVLGLVSLAVLGATALTLFGDQLTSDIGNSRAGGELASFTGRDQIWPIALREWDRFPWVGYGHTLFNDDYRQMIGMPFATHGHNQYIDTLARSGTIGGIGLTIFVIALTIMAFKTARRTQGLSLGLLVLIVVRMFTEVPVHFTGYGTESFTLFTLFYCAVQPRTAFVATPTPLQTAQPQQPYAYHEPTYAHYSPQGQDGSYGGAQHPSLGQGPTDPSLGDMRHLR